MLCVIVISAPIIVKGHVTYVEEDVFVCGWKDMVKGLVAISVRGKFCCSVWIVPLVEMYLAVDNVG